MDDRPLAADNHVHSQWSWDTSLGDMEATCAEAVRLGVPSVAFTEHVDHTVWQVGSTDGLPADWTRHGVDEGRLVPPAFDADGYLESVDRCRSLFPDLRIVTGVELGEPHWHRAEVDALLATGAFRRVLASMHSAHADDGHVDVGRRFAERPAVEVYAEYLREVETLVTTYEGYEVLAHVDYPLRRWPADQPLDVTVFEDQLRHVLAQLATTGRVLELNTRVPLPATILRWWHEAGGQAISFASDAHRPSAVAAGFRAAMAMADGVGFRPGRPGEFWVRG